MENLNSTDKNDATVTRGAEGQEDCNLGGIFTFDCYDPQGNLKWHDTGKNLVVNQGKNQMLNSFLGLSPALASAWFMSLTTAGTIASSSTYASPTVTEITNSIVATRPTMAFSSASGGSISATTTAFTIIGTATITGNLVVTATSNGSTIGNTGGAGGILFSSSTFTGGNKAVSNGDTLQVSYSLSV